MVPEQSIGSSAGVSSSLLADNPSLTPFCSLSSSNPLSSSPLHFSQTFPPYSSSSHTLSTSPPPAPPPSPLSHSSLFPLPSPLLFPSLPLHLPFPTLSQAVNFWQVLVMNDEHTERRYLVYLLLGWGLPALVIIILVIVLLGGFGWTIHSVYGLVHEDV